MNVPQEEGGSGEMANWRGIFLLASSSVNNSVTMLLPNRYPQTRRLVARGAYACFLVFSSMHDPSFAGKEVSMTGVCQSGNQLHALAESLPAQIIRTTHPLLTSPATCQIENHYAITEVFYNHHIRLGTVLPSSSDAIRAACFKDRNFSTL
jgi:hypothetical protein